MKPSQNYQVHIVAGPTAAGKTDYAIQLAKKTNGVLINADSRQVYKYLDIGTNKGKVTKVGSLSLASISNQLPVHNFEDMDTSIHLLSFLEPDQRFSVTSYQQLAVEIINYLIKHGNTPILVGGSGLYIRSITNPESVSKQVPPDQQLREKLNKESLSELQKQIPAPELEKMNRSDRMNPVRLIRRIEVNKHTQGSESLTSQDSKKELDILNKLQVTKHYRKLPMDLLETRITKRVHEMWEAGLVAEVESVLNKGFAPDCPGLSGSGYSDVIKYLRNDISAEECKKNIVISHRQVAKKQVTWFDKYFQD